MASEFERRVAKLEETIDPPGGVQLTILRWIGADAVLACGVAVSRQAGESDLQLQRRAAEEARDPRARGILFIGDTARAAAICHARLSGRLGG
jgi:hypothetical protein